MQIPQLIAACFRRAKSPADSDAHQTDSGKGKVMTVYIVAQLKFTRRELYDRYQSRFADVFRKFKGKLLVADENPVVTEGNWERDKFVIMEFPDDAAALEFQTSPEYLEIAEDRKAGADAVVLTVRGWRRN